MTGKGFSANHTMPSIVYFDWFTEYYQTLKKVRAKEQSSSRRVLYSLQAPKLNLGVVISHGENRNVGLEPVQGQKRLLISAYEKLLSNLKNYASMPVYSNSHDLNTQTYSDKVQNMSFVDSLRDHIHNVYLLAIIFILSFILG